MVPVPVAEPVEVIEVLAERIDREGDGNMTQDEKWNAQYDEVVAFINNNHRNPSKYLSEERGLVNWCKHQRKIINAGEMKPERMRSFEMLQELMEKYKRVNQYL